MNLLDQANTMIVVEKVKPDEAYNLAAQRFVRIYFYQPILTSEVDAIGALRLFEAIRMFKLNTKLNKTSTSEMYVKVLEIPRTEKTPFYPRSPYDVAKLFGHWILVNCRESFDMLACSGILFNYESPLRGVEFVIRKITYHLTRIKYGLQDKLIFGNLDARKDWGYAKEYVEGMRLMFQQEEPDDYALATSETHTVREFVEKSAEVAGFDIQWKGEGVNTKGIDRKSGKVIIEVSPEFYRPVVVDILIGNPKKAEEKLG